MTRLKYLEINLGQFSYMLKGQKTIKQFSKGVIGFFKEINCHIMKTETTILII